MTAEQNGQIALENIRKWAASQPKLVIGIDGIPGSGKTTLLNFLKDHGLDIVDVHIDDFMTPLAFRKEEIEGKSDINQKKEFFIKNWFDYSEIRELITQFKDGRHSKFSTKLYRKGDRSLDQKFDLDKPILILEGILLYHSELLDDLWDRRIFIDGDEQKIKERRIAREREKWGDAYISEDDDPNSWYRFILEGIKDYQEKYNPKQKADLILTVE